MKIFNLNLNKSCKESNKLTELEHYNSQQLKEKKKQAWRMIYLLTGCSLLSIAIVIWASLVKDNGSSFALVGGLVAVIMVPIEEQEKKIRRINRILRERGEY